VEFDDQRVDASQLQDRRGMSSGAKMGAGVGGLGILGLIIALLLGGGLPGSDTSSQPAASTDVAVRCNQPGAIAQYDDCYALKIFNEVNEVWPQQVRGYRPPTLVFFERGVQTRCGPAASQSGPFYCPGDSNVYIDLGFPRQLQQQLGAPGRNAQAYVIAHEVGHHIQNITGTERKVRQLQQQNPRRANELSVRLELQADCYAGVWARLANDNGNVRITQQEFDQAMNAAAAVGDDRIQTGAGARVNPESWTHGSAQQRQTCSARASSQAIRACATRSADRRVTDCRGSA
jgi:uncharacterized protein